MLILAGGKGSRLKPVLPDVPKVLAPVGGRPFLEYIFDQLIDAGLRDVVLLTGEGHDDVERCFGPLFNTLRLRYSRDEDGFGGKRHQGTAGAVFAAHGITNPEEPVLVMNGDTLVKGLDFEELYAERVRDVTEPIVVVVDKASAGPGMRPIILTRPIEYDPRGLFVHAGAELLPQAFVLKFATGNPGAREIETYLFEQYQVYISNGQALDIGTPEGYAAAAHFVHQGPPTLGQPRGESIADHLLDSADVLGQSAVDCADDIEAAASLMRKTFDAGGKVMLCGNGGSAADAQHMATDLMAHGRPAVALTTDTSFLTAYPNDHNHGFDDIFAAQVRALGKPEDTLIGISTSGRSRNVVRALNADHGAPMSTIALTGKNRILGRPKVSIEVPSDVTEHIQEAHAAIEHLLCKLVAVDN